MKWGILLALSACGGAQAAADDVERPPEQCPESMWAELPEPPAFVEWWKQGAAACPDGAALKGQAPPFGEEVWCETPDGTRHGRWTWWYDDDRLLSDGAHDADGKPHGPWIAWHENGKRKMQGNYDHGLKHGRWVMWHESGEPSTDIQFEAGLQHGKWVWWYESGNKAGEGEFLREKPHGRWTRCAEDGTITKVEIYDNDRLVDWIDYEHGRRIAEY